MHRMGIGASSGAFPSVPATRGPLPRPMGRRLRRPPRPPPARGWSLSYLAQIPRLIAWPWAHRGERMGEAAHP
eukprot:90166-Prorocentrum_lima.AAC.1